jgi:hypothetical protein
MASTYTSALRLTLPTTGDLFGTWGDTINAGTFSLVEQALAGRGVVPMTDADYTLSALNGTSDEARNMVVRMTGTLTAARNVIVPTQAKLYILENATTGGFALTLKTAAGTGISVPNATSLFLRCDGTNVVNAFSGSTGSVTNVTGTAPVVSSGGATPAISMAAATTSVPGYLTAADWTTFNGKQAALVSGTSIKTLGGATLLGAGDYGTLGAGFGGTGQTSYTNGQLLIGNTTGNTLTKASLTAGANITITPGAGSITIAASVSSPTWTVKTANYTMVQGDAIMANTTGGAFTLTLPLAPSANDRIPLCDYGNTFQTNNLTVGANGNKIHGTVADMIFTAYFYGALTYIDSTQGWKITP